MHRTISQKLLTLSKGESLLDITYSFLLIACYAKQSKNVSHIQTSPDMYPIRTSIFKAALEKWPDTGPFQYHFDKVDNSTITKLIEIVVSLDQNFDDVEFQIRNLITDYTKRLSLSYTPTVLKELIVSIVDTYRQKLTLNTFYDFNARSGDLISQIFTLDLEQTPTLYLEESNPIMHQIGSMLFELSGVERIKFFNKNSLIDSEFIKNKMKADCVLSYPRLSIMLNDEESLPYKPYLSVLPKNNEKIHSPEALYIQLIKFSLNKNGIGLFVVSDGFLSRHGYDKEVREYFIKQNLIEAVISLPNNLYTGTTLSTSLIVVRRNRHPSAKVHFINLSKDFITPDTIKDTCNKLSNLKANSKSNTSVSRNLITNNQYSLRPIEYLNNEINQESFDSNIAQLELDQAMADYFEAYQKWRQD